MDRLEEKSHQVELYIVASNSFYFGQTPFLGFYTHFEFSLSLSGRGQLLWLNGEKGCQPKQPDLCNMFSLEEENF